MVRTFLFCSYFYVDVIANMFLLHIFTDLKTDFISCNMILKLKSFIQISAVIFHQKLRVVVYFFDKTRYSTSIYHLVSQLLRYNIQIYSLGESILLAYTKEYTLLYIPYEFQGV